MKDFKRKLSIKEMLTMDINTTDFGIPIEFLMENAGAGSARTIIDKFNLKKGDNVLIFCGTGNNGGDGFVIARHLATQQISASVLLIGSPNKLRTKETILNWNILNNLYFYVKTFIVTDSSYFTNITDKLPSDIQEPSVIVDCLMGTGVKGKIREPIKSAIKLINIFRKKGIKVVSIDVPSGIDPNSGQFTDIAVGPDLLITMHRQKLGMDKIKIKIPEIIENNIGILYDADIFIGTGDLKQNLTRRKINNHKTQHGKVLIIGGSKTFSGAPALAAMAALEMDMDLVIVYAPNSVANVIRSYSPNLIVKEGKSSNITDNDIDEIIELIKWADSIVIGPGLGVADETKIVFGKILEKIVESKKPTVIDADGITHAVSYKDYLKKGNFILTPHAAEFIRLTGTKLPDQQDFMERSKILELVARKFGTTFLLKGKFDYISNSEHTRINKTGIPQMAVGGTGDLLTGILASLLALKIDLFNAGCVAAYISGKLGEEYLKHEEIMHQNQIKSFKSSDLIKIIPKILGKYL